MASEVGSAYVSIVPSTRGFGRALNSQVGGASAEAGTRSGRLFGSSFNTATAGVTSRISGVLGVAARGAAIGLAGVGAAGLGIGIKTAAGMEQARIAFETMLGSAGKADKFLRDLQSFAAKTPFEFPELQTAASSLISAGVNAEKVIPIMTSLGNATSGMGTGSEGVKRATVALQQMAAAGRITGEDLNQLRDAGIPVFDLLSAATGRTKEAVAQMAQKGKLGKKEMEQLFTALETGKGLERFNGLMEKQSQSLSGLFSSLKDNVQLTLANLIQPAFPAIKAGLAGITALSAKVGPALHAAFGPVKATITALRDGFSGDVGASGFIGAMQRIGDAVGQMRDGLTGANSGITGPFQKAASILRTVALRIVAVFQSRVLPVLQTVGAFISDHLAPIMAVFSGALGGVLLGAVGALTAALAGPLIGVLVAVVGALTSPIAVIGALVGAFIYAYQHSTTLRNGLAQVGAFITGTVVPAVQGLANLFTSRVLPVLRAVGGYLVSTFTPTFRALAAFVTGTVVPAVQGLLARIRENGQVFRTFGVIAGTIATVVGVVVTKLAGFLLPILIKVAGFLVKTVFAAIGKVIGILGGVIRVAADVGMAFLNMAITATRAISGLTGMLSRIPLIGDKFKGMQTGIDAAATKLEGFKAGLQSLNGTAAKVELTPPVKSGPARVASAAGRGGITSGDGVRSSTTVYNLNGPVQASDPGKLRQQLEQRSRLAALGAA